MLTGIFWAEFWTEYRRGVRVWDKAPHQAGEASSINISLPAVIALSYESGTVRTTPCWIYRPMLHHVMCVNAEIE
jgi:hypothetical protein